MNDRRCKNLIKQLCHYSRLRTEKGITNINDLEFFSFLKEESPNFVKWIKSPEFFNNLVEKFEKSNGLCYALTMNRNLNRITDKAAWWAAAMMSVLEWNGERDSLNEQITLPQAENKLGAK